MQPLQILQQIAGSLDRLDSADAVHRAMDEVEFVFELLPPELQELASGIRERLDQRLRLLQSGG